MSNYNYLGNIMSSSVFISGSIAIKTLPEPVKESILKIIGQNMMILIGDAPGIDTLVQDFCKQNNYTNVTIYTITSSPRYIANQSFDFKYIFVDSDIKKERERQGHKDRAMSDDSTYSLVVWDGSSKGSYGNILSALKQKKQVKVFYQEIEDFIPTTQVNTEEIEYIYREHNGYTAAEVIEYLQNSGNDTYKRSQDLNKFLIAQNMLIKDGNIYQPTDKNPELFIIEKYRGKPKGVKFNSEFIDWIEHQSTNPSRQTDSLFD